MYNSIKLDQRARWLDASNWGLQRYLWHDTLDPTQPPEEKVIKTLIYGVKSSDNQAERGLRETARLMKHKYPEIHPIIIEDIYVDDCLSGTTTMARAQSIADKLVVNHGGQAERIHLFKPASSTSIDNRWSISISRWPKMILQGKHNNTRS